MLISLFKGEKLVLVGLLPLDLKVKLIRQKLTNNYFDGFKALGLVKVVFNGENGSTLQQTHYGL